MGLRAVLKERKQLQLTWAHRTRNNSHESHPTIIFNRVNRVIKKPEDGLAAEGKPTSQR